MTFRPTTLGDLPAIEKIIGDAVRRMNSEGNLQWTYQYPTAAHITADILNGNGYVIEDDGIVMAYGAVVFTGEPSYQTIEGTWLSGEDYVVVHRLAVSQGAVGKGIGTGFLQSVEKMSVGRGMKSFRVDTNFNNNAMLHLLAKEGFTFCGMIKLERGGTRKAFEKLI